MAEQGAATPQAKATGSAATRPPKPPNPLWRMMGLPNFRFRLPSRNWMIFLSISGSWTAAVIYDRREKKRIQKKWAKVVSHIAKEPLDTNQLPRKLSVYLSAPPADNLASAREHFNEYVKPVLVSAALDWDAVEGRREGDVRAGIAEKIRRLRKKSGEASKEPPEEELEDVLEQARARSGIKNSNEVAGDIVIGRHAWREYVRGLHEGWLGPLDPPPTPEDSSPQDTATSPAITTEITSPPADDASPTTTESTPAQPEPEKPAEEAKDKLKKRTQPPPFNTTADYSSSTLSPNCPPELPPSTTIPFPHLLGFLNTPVRMYRFLNRRQLADEVGRQTAAAVLAIYRPYEGPGESHFQSETGTSSTGEDDNNDNSKWEQQRLLQHEEKEWHKSARERKEDDEKERVWLDDIVLDPRIAERMRKFELDMEAEELAKRVAKEDPWWSTIWPGKKEKKGNQWGDEGVD